MSKPKADDMSDFVGDVDNSLGRYIHWAGAGPAGSGKTHFLLSAPGPVVVHLFNDFDGVSLIKDKPEFAGKNIKWVNYDFNPSRILDPDEYTQTTKRTDAALAELERFHKNYVISLRNFRTVGIDKDEALWELIRYARFGAMTTRPNKYYEPNLEFAGIFHDASKAGVNLGILRGMKEKWGLVNGDLKGLGINEPRGQKVVSEKVHVNLAHHWSAEEKEFKITIAPPSNGQKDDEGPKLRVGNAAELIGQEFGNFDFLQLAMAIYPESSPGDWGLE